MSKIRVWLVGAIVAAFLVAPFAIEAAVKAVKISGGIQTSPQASNPLESGKPGFYTDSSSRPIAHDGTTANKIAACNATAKGDLCAYTGSAWTKRSVGTNGQCLKAQSANSDGVEWGSCGGGGSGTLQDGYDNSSDPVTITQDNTRKGLVLKANSNGDSPLILKNSAGTQVAHFDADGALETRYHYTTSTATDALQFEAATANSSTNNAFQFNNTTALSGSTTLATFGSNNVVKATIGNDGSYTGSSTSAISARHFPRLGSTPTCAVGGAAGSGASCSVAGRDEGGVVTVNTGTGTTGSDVLVTVTFAAAWGTDCAVTASYADGTTSAAFNQFSVSRTLDYDCTSTTFVISSGTTAPPTSTTVKFNYTVVGW